MLRILGPGEVKRADKRSDNDSSTLNDLQK